MSNQTASQQQQALGTLRQIHFELETNNGDLEILLNQIFGQIDAVSNPDENTQNALAVINCFVKCALAQTQKIRLNNRNAQVVICAAVVGGDHA